MNTKKDLLSASNTKKAELESEQAQSQQNKLDFLNFKKVRKTKKGGLLIVLDDNKAIHINEKYFKKVVGG